MAQVTAELLDPTSALQYLTSHGMPMFSLTRKSLRDHTIWWAKGGALRLVKQRVGDIQRAHRAAVTQMVDHIRLHIVLPPLNCLGKEVRGLKASVHVLASGIAFIQCTRTQIPAYRHCLPLLAR